MNRIRSWRLLVGLLFVGIATLALPAFGEQRARSQVVAAASVSDVDDSGDRVRAVLTVDQGGRPVAGLTMEAVTVSDNGRAAPVTSLQPVVDEAIPLALVLVIDTSGSMAGQLAEVQTAALDLVAQLGPADATSLVAFASEVTPPQALASDVVSLQAAIADLEAFGDTALYDAVVAAADLARDAGFERRAVVLLTDGEDFGGVSTAERQASLEAAAGVAAFYTIGVGPSVDSDYLGELAAGTGGRFFPASTGTEIVEVYATIEELLRSQYIIEFERGDAVGGEDRSLEVTVDIDGFAVVAAADYVSAAPAAAPVVQATAAAAPVVAATPAPEAAAPAPAQTGSSSSLTRAALLLVASVLLAGGGVLLLRRRRQPRRRRPAPVAAPRLDARPITRPSDRRPDVISGRLALVGHGDERAVDVGTVPITIGSGDGSQLWIESSAGSAPAHARVWTRDGRVMVHHVAEGFETQVNGRPVEWAVLSDGDELQIGSHTIRYRAGVVAEPAMASPGGA